MVLQLVELASPAPLDVGQTQLAQTMQLEVTLVRGNSSFGLAIKAPENAGALFDYFSFAIDPNDYGFGTEAVAGFLLLKSEMNDLVMSMLSAA